jgi:hypothetical protein
MKHATSIALHAYWQSRRGRTGSTAGGIRAAELAPLLPTLFLIELDFAAGCRFRFTGGTFATRYGRDLTGESFLALWSVEDRGALERDLGIIATRAAGLVAGILAETISGGFTAFEMLLLPIAVESGVAGAIGSMVRVGGHEEVNRIRARLVTQSLRSVRFLAPANRAVATRDEIPDRVPPSMQSVPRNYGHLTVLPGGK